MSDSIGVGDKYFYKKNPGQTDEFEEFEKKFRANQMEKAQNNNTGQDQIIYHKDKDYGNGLRWGLVKNP